MTTAAGDRFGRIALLQAAFWVTAASYISYGVSLVVGAVVARSLGPREYGKYAYVVWLTGLLVIIANNGVTSSAIRFVSENLGGGRPAQASHIQHWLQRRQWMCIGAVLCVFSAWAFHLGPPNWPMNPASLVALVSVCVYARAMYLFEVSIAKGHGDFHVEPSSTTLFALLSGAAAAALAWRHASTIDFIYLYCAGSVGLLGFASRSARRAGIVARPGVIDPITLGELRKHLMWTALLAISVTLGSRSIETYLLAVRFGPEQVAYYTIAGGLMRAGVDLLTVGLSAVLLPAMSRAHGAGGVEQVRPIFSDSLRYLVFIGLLLAGGGALWADPVLRLMYGSRYLPAIPVLQAMMVCAGLGLSEATTGSLLTTTGRQQTRAWVVFGNLGVAIPLAFWLVPRYGLAGATLSYVISRSFYSVVIGAIALNATATPVPAVMLMRLLAAAAVAAAAAIGVVAKWPGIAGWFLAGTAYAAVLILSSIFMRAWSIRDVDLAAQILDKAPRSLSWARPLLARWRERYAS